VLINEETRQSTIEKVGFRIGTCPVKSYISIESLEVGVTTGGPVGGRHGGCPYLATILLPKERIACSGNPLGTTLLRVVITLWAGFS